MPYSTPITSRINRRHKPQIRWWDYSSRHHGGCATRAGEGALGTVHAAPAPPEVRCLTPKVPARRGWGVLLTGAASAVVGIERARGAGLLVSGLGSGLGCGWSRDLDLPVEVPTVGAPPQPRCPLLACQLAVDRRPRSRARRGWALPATFAPPGANRCASTGTTRALRGRRFLPCPELTLLRGLGGAPGFQGAPRNCPPWHCCHWPCRLPGCAPKRLDFFQSRPHVPLLEIFAFASIRSPPLWGQG